MPVEIWLFFSKKVKVPLAWCAVRLGDASPGGWAEVRDQFAWANLAILAKTISKNVAVALRAALRRLQRCLKPFVLV